uniref:Uncharacterized protein n=1 Tax=Cacopsylla melanoneura TaxID=428564 RepID=A0A8D8M7N8_9HEMI
MAPSQSLVFYSSTSDGLGDINNESCIRTRKMASDIFQVCQKRQHSGWSRLGKLLALVLTPCPLIRATPPVLTHTRFYPSTIFTALKVSITQMQSQSIRESLMLVLNILLLCHQEGSTCMFCQQISLEGQVPQQE